MINDEGGAIYINFPNTVEVRYIQADALRVEVRLIRNRDRRVILQMRKVDGEIPIKKQDTSWILTNTSKKMDDGERVDPILINELNQHRMLDYMMQMLTGKMRKNI